MPVYNTEKYVAESVDSVLAQTHNNIELICIDNGSTDDSLAVLESFGDRITIIRSKENLGIAEGRNQGIRVAQGEYLAFMDADDLWEPNKLELQRNRFEQDPNLDICFCYMRNFLSPELSDEIKALRYCPPVATPALLSPAVMIKTTSFHRVGELNPRWSIGEFMDWFERAKELGLTYVCLEDILLKRRIHETNTGVRDRASRNDYLKVIRESLRRKRTAAVD